MTGIFPQEFRIDSFHQLTVSLADLDESAFATIGAGETITVDHDGKSAYLLKHHSFLTSDLTVSSLFNFASAGEGTYTFELVTTFQMADVAAKVAASTLDKVTVSSTSVDVHISGDLAARDVASIDKRATPVCSDSTKKAFITSRFVASVCLYSHSNFI